MTEPTLSLSDATIANIIAWCKEHWDMDFTVEHVRIIAHDPHTIEAIEDSRGVSDTYPREYWMDAVAAKFTGREEWPCNNDDIDGKDFAHQLWAGYKRLLAESPNRATRDD
jgi:hypothetical protein